MKYRELNLGQIEALVNKLGGMEGVKRFLAGGGKVITDDLLERVVQVIRSRTPQAMLEATGRRQYVDKGVVAAMPKGDGDEATLCFFKVGRYVSDADLDKEYELRGLKPADPYALGAVNEADPAFADDRPNATHWQDADGKWCYAAFGRWVGGERLVPVNRHGSRWYDRWWFAGVRK